MYYTYLSSAWNKEVSKNVEYAIETKQGEINHLCVRNVLIEILN